MVVKFFQILSINGETPEYLSWKDTVNVPRKAVIKIAWMPDNRPGKWMYHCHILHHEDDGMMGSFIVYDPFASISERFNPQKYTSESLHR